MTTSVSSRKLPWAMSLMVLGSVSTASAHHSATASYEADRFVEIKGTVLELAWRNPHCHLYIEVTAGPFKAQTYAVELGSPSVMAESGWTKKLLQPGDLVSIQVHPSRVGAAIGLCRDCALTINGKVAKPRLLQ